ncbi:AfsR/SARP family transcriptional regulator [Streptomyces chumphonensis]|uniref:AfsR/SARP family transcriptional regulator n=1 Tax=Streptomyces chumphonensis TaxID=1214925 RepID=UPI003D76533E
MYRYGVLGAVRVERDDGSAVAVGGSRLRALLTALAVRPGHVVGVPALTGAVWPGGDAPADPQAALQALVGRLRRTLGRDAVELADGGYRLAARPDDVDLHRFERLTAQGIAALDAGRPAAAVSVLDEALALWRGPALADLSDTADRAGVDPAARRAEARRTEARRARAEAVLATGGAAQALPELAQLCAEHPLDERAQLLRLRALRDAGRPAEALAAYESVRARLAARLGTDPGPGLRALHAELLTRTTAPTAPLPEPPAAPPAAPASPPGSLRPRLTSFVGREDELAALRAELPRHRLVTLLGTGGCGKTRLAQEAADALAGHYPDGVRLAELASVRDPATVPEAVLTALGGRETVLGTSESLRAATRAGAPAADPLDRLAEHCAPRRMLLILDNCEHVIDAAARLAERLALSCPHVTVLATSREPLGVGGESVVVVDPLPQAMALRLLQDRGAATRAGFSTAEDPTACADLCRRLDGLPLAIELAAARLRSLAPRQLVDRLGDRFRLLTGGSRTALPRQQTLRAVVDWSWDLLDGAERAVLRRLAVCTGGCAPEQAEEVCAGAGVAARDVVPLLGSLVDKSLVVADTTPDGMRYRLLETVAEYAAERLDEAGEGADTRRRHLTAYRELARTTEPLLRGPGQRVHLERLERDHDNLRAALRRAVDAAEEHEALGLLHGLQWFWTLRGHSRDATTWSREVCGLFPDPFAPPAEPAVPVSGRATAVPPPLPPDRLAEARRGAWLLRLCSGEPDMDLLSDPAYRARLREITRVYRPGLPQTCHPPGYAWLYALILLSEGELLFRALDATVDAARAGGEEWDLAFALHMRTRFALERPPALEQAARDAEEALAIFTRLQDAWGVAQALSGHGEIDERRGDLAAAAGNYEAAVALAEELGAHSEVPLLRARLAGVHLEADGDPELVGRVLREALRDGEGQSEDVVVFARVLLTMWHGRYGRTREAHEQLGVLRTRFHEGSPPMFRGMIDGMAAWLHVLEGAHGQALVLLRDTLARTAEDRVTQLVAPHLTTTQLATAAEALAGVGRAEDAARVLGAFDARDLPLGAGTRNVRDCRERAEAAVRPVLEDAAYARAHAEGARLAPADVALLCGPPDRVPAPAAHPPRRA